MLEAFLLDPLFIFIKFPFHYHLFNHSLICICNPFQIVLLVTSSTFHHYLFDLQVINFFIFRFCNWVWLNSF
ncbi:unnamed protein product [Prunus brigantina]